MKITSNTLRGHASKEASDPVMDDASFTPKARGGIQSLERAFAILEHVVQFPDGVGLSDLSRSVGMHLSTTSHLVKTLVKLGYVTQIADSRRYRIGMRLFAMASSSMSENTIVHAATPILEQLAAETGECTHLAVLSGSDVIIIAKAMGAGMLQLSEGASGVRPVYCTAIGKILLSHLEEPELRRILDGKPMLRRTPKTIIEWDALLAELETTRKRGLAIDDAEFDGDVRCAAMLVHDFTGGQVAAIGFSGPIWRLSLSELQEKSEMLAHAAAELSEQLGFRGVPASAHS
ncbi:IclR family transcriptional regulator [Alcaligenaceae bacterium CGII-47]|nr:IclR family transcriptional regulator [Alcaligenaceae bacterium CGII-47]